MNLTHLRELVELANRLNYRETAEALFISQPALSKHVTLAEKEVGFKIFSRDTTHVELTDQGRKFVESMEQLLVQYDKTLRDIHDGLHANQKPIRVFGPFAYGPAYAILSSGIDLSQFTCTFVESGVRDPDIALLENRADLSIGIRYRRTSRHVICKRISATSLGVALTKNHRLARPNLPIHLTDLAEETIYTYPNEGYDGWHDFLATICAKKKVHLTIKPFQDSSVLFPTSPNEVCIGTTFPGYARYLNPEAIIKEVAGFHDCFDICVFRRKSETNERVAELYDALTRTNLR